MGGSVNPDCLAEDFIIASEADSPETLRSILEENLKLKEKGC